ncbi:hypothetical protein DFJ73DRAFT_953328 [Zopfochytrium polystomum]|nr:hypothetical protein DFJ73DRAFT_953328 [Zopfochytrium polystomum]
MHGVPTTGGGGSGGGAGGGIIGQVIQTICDTFAGGENTDEKLQLQIVKALMSAVSSVDPVATIHGAVLLKAVRTTYNIFLLSKSVNAQTISQASLTQMVQAVFGRVAKDAPAPTPANAPPDAKAASPAPSALQVEVKDARKGTESEGSSLSSQKENSSRESFKSADESREKKPPGDAGTAKPAADMVEQCLKDAQLVFRTLCKLSMKPIPAPEGVTDLKSQAMRSKLLALHLLNTVLSSHIHIFFTPSPVLFPPGQSGQSVLFINSVKQYLCLALSRNAVSVVPQVFEISLDLFGRALVSLRTVMKKEISVIFTEIIIPIVEAKSSITFNQRVSLLKCLSRILSEPSSESGRLLVEIYINYDCDPEASARENIWERLVTALGRVMVAQEANQGGGAANLSAGAPSTNHPSKLGDFGHPGTQSLPPTLTTSTLTSLTKEQVKGLYSSTGDYAEMRKRGLELLVAGIINPLISWSKSKGGASPVSSTLAGSPVESESGKSDGGKSENDPALGLVKEPADGSQPGGGFGDDPTQFQNLKHRKQVILEGVTRFNQKPKKGIQYILDAGCVFGRTPKEIAQFLQNTDGLDKTMIGEFLGEGEEENIAIMHAYVDEFDFTAMPFVQALRSFLQSFRLPGEAQKIDRFMLKFAERYVQGNPTSFSSADTAYVLAYSVIMLNTDQHNAQVKKRMTKADFLKNNRGIDEGKNLPNEMLEAIFDEISTKEIVMKEEQEKLAAPPALAVPTMRKELSQYAIASENMAMKTEAIFQTIMKTGRRGQSGNGTSQFHVASHFEHIKPMFQISWMSVLAALTGTLQESDDEDVVTMALDGLKGLLTISCRFDMEEEKKAIFSTLARFTQQPHPCDTKPKHVLGIKTLIDVSLAASDQINESWMEVVVSVSLLEKIQQLGAEQSNQRSFQDRNRQASNQIAKAQKMLNEETIALASSQVMTLTVDKLFTSSSKFSGTAIVHFVKALCKVSWDEISSSAAASEHPRMYCLQRLVEISYYNMNRIRVEWSNLWAILGEHFNQVGCYSNTQVCFFALDKLRQLSMKFLELEELPNFKFQKDFLRPFEYILRENPDPKIKDMALACLMQMIQAKAKGIKSGWKAMFSAFLRAAREPYEQISLLAFDILKTIFKSHFENIIANFALPDFVLCLVAFCKNRNFAKISLHAVELLRQSFTKILELTKSASGSKLLHLASGATEKNMIDLISGTPASLLLVKNSERFFAALTTPVQASIPDLSANVSSAATSMSEEVSFVFVFPILYGLFDAIMSSDLEVRTRALTYLFDIIKGHGSFFSVDSWEIVARGVLFPIFDDLKLKQESSPKFANKEEQSVWLSTTLIQALRQFVDLFGHYLPELFFCVDGLLEVLAVCMTHENETLARIGSTCLTQFVENNATRLSDDLWNKICNMFTHLFKMTTPTALFFDYREQIPELPSTIVPPPETDDLDALSGADHSADKANKPPPLALGPGRTNSQLFSFASITAVPATFDAAVPDISGRPKPQKKDFQLIIQKCVLHLLVIQTVQDILCSTSAASHAVYESIGSECAVTMLSCLERSYRFAKAFNEDMELRMALYRMGFMKQLPNLLKQETSSVSTYVSVLVRMYADPSEERKHHRAKIGERLIPLCLEILSNYNKLDPEAKRRNVAAWRPVVVVILNAFLEFDDDQFNAHIPQFYYEFVDILLQDLTPDVRTILHSILARAGSRLGISRKISL